MKKIIYFLIIVFSVGVTAGCDIGNNGDTTDVSTTMEKTVSKQTDVSTTMEKTVSQQTDVSLSMIPTEVLYQSSPKIFDRIFNDYMRPAGDNTTNFRKDISSFYNEKWFQGQWLFNKGKMRLYGPLDESMVFHAEMSHTASGSDKNWIMRIGKGGQIYSYVMQGMKNKYPDSVNKGEVMPPQSRTSGDWVDDTTTLTWCSYPDINKRVDPKYGSMGHIGDSGTDSTAGYIHQAGVYIHKDPEVLDNRQFYSPCLGDYWDQASRSYYMVNWGQMAHIPSVWQSSMLIYTRYRDIGDGVVEVTYVSANFGDFPFSDLSTPWGGVRRSALPDFVLSNTDGSYKQVAGRNDPWEMCQFSQIVPASRTGGWIANAEDAGDPESYALGWVLGKDPVVEGLTKDEKAKLDWDQELICYGWGDKYMHSSQADEEDPNIKSLGQPREFNVIANAYRYIIRPGDVVYANFYLVSGKLKDVASKCNELVDKVHVGYMKLEQSNADIIPLYEKTIKKQKILDSAGDGEPLCYIYAQPAQGTRPLYLLHDTQEDRYVVTTDPYLLASAVKSSYNDMPAYRPYDGRTEYIKLLGFVSTSQRTDGSLQYKTLADIVPDKSYFPGTGNGDDGVMVRVK